MKLKVRKAFKAEIDLWRKIAMFPSDFIFGESVARPLCKEVKKCQNCPVKDFTGVPLCIDTPLWEWKMQAIEAAKMPLPENLLKVGNMAVEMRAFLSTVYKHS